MEKLILEKENWVQGPKRNSSMTKAGGDDWFVNKLLFWIISFILVTWLKWNLWKFIWHNQGLILDDSIKFVRPNLYDQSN